MAKCFQKWKKVLKRLAQEDTSSQPPAEQQVTRMIQIRAAQNEAFGYVVDQMKQRVTFDDVLAHTKKNDGTSTSLSQIKRFVPFLDRDGLLRVGGRLSNSSECPKNQNTQHFYLQTTK